MKPTFFALLVVLALASPALAQPPIAPIVSPLQPTFVTSGQAMVVARPDRAFVTIVAESRSRNSADASTPVEPSTIEIHARVTLTASLR